MMMPDPNIAGFVLERARQTVDGGLRVIYDAAPIGYAGLKLERVCNESGLVIGEFYRVAGRVFFCPNLAAAALHREYDYRVSM
jgi:hypothetical protein